ncbi:hypothetical protein AVEN_148223-1 [Araneus ventricosus]|uniref:Uncharacterized protein n=1 Tax=Araneus ventricosus TaxID=182803 RepID=A0A4Y2PXF9_ARAVE|nr:hypothetical protein AVEN_148223-1 [Araneus ventricosus]
MRIRKYHQSGISSLKSLPSGLLSGVKRSTLKMKEVLKEGKEERMSSKLSTSFISHNVFLRTEKRGKKMHEDILSECIAYKIIPASQADCGFMVWEKPEGKWCQERTRFVLRRKCDNRS